MWTLRRASIPLRTRGFNVRASCFKLALTKEESDVSESRGTMYGGFLSRNLRHHSERNASLNFTVGRCGFSSSSIKEEDDSEDWFSEHKTDWFSVLETAAGDGNESYGLMTSETDLYGDGEKEDAEEPHGGVDETPKAKEKLTLGRGRVLLSFLKEILDARPLDKWSEEEEKLTPCRGRIESELFKEILDAPGISIHSDLDKRLEEEEKLTPCCGSVESELFKEIFDAPGMSIHSALDKRLDEEEKLTPHCGRDESELFKQILDAPAILIHSALDRWLEEGNELNREEVSFAILNLRKRKLFWRALQLYEWLESKNQFEFAERDYASRLDLIAKTRGLQEAEVYFENIPKSCRSEIIYQTLFANCFSQNNVKKAEEVFRRMKDLGFPIDGVDQIVDKSIEANIKTLDDLVGRYISAGRQDKADTLLKDMESVNRRLRRTLLHYYACLGKVDEVGRIWKDCEKDPQHEDCLVAIDAWLKLNKIDEAEKVFEMMIKKWKLSSKACSELKKVYANNKMLIKGKDVLVKLHFQL